MSSSGQQAPPTGVPRQPAWGNQTRQQLMSLLQTGNTTAPKPTQQQHQAIPTRHSSAAPPTATATATATTQAPPRGHWASVAAKPGRSTVRCSICLLHVDVPPPVDPPHWPKCYQTLHCRLFGTPDKVNKAVAESIKQPFKARYELMQAQVSHDTLLYPTCQQLQCQHPLIPPVNTTENKHNSSTSNDDFPCRFRAVQEPFVLMFEHVWHGDYETKHSDFTRPKEFDHAYRNRKCMGQTAMAIIQPQIHMVGSGHKHTITVIDSTLLQNYHYRDEHEENTEQVLPYRCLFRYAQLTGHVDPVVLNDMLRFQRILGKPGSFGKVFVMIGILDSDTMKWIRGTRLSPSLVPSLTILLCLKTMTGGDYLMCVYDGAQSKLYDSSKFNFFSKQTRHKEGSVDHLIDQVFRTNAKALRKSGLIDKFWGKPHLSENVFFAFPPDHTIPTRQQTNGTSFWKRYDKLYASCQQQHLLGTIEDKMIKLQLERPRTKVDTHKDESDSVTLRSSIRTHLNNAIQESKLELVQAKKYENNGIKIEHLNQRINDFTWLLETDGRLNRLVQDVSKHIQHYKDERKKMNVDDVDESRRSESRVVFDLDLGHVLDDFCRKRDYSWRNLQSQPFQPIICNMNPGEQEEEQQLQQQDVQQTLLDRIKQQEQEQEQEQKQQHQPTTTTPDINHPPLSFKDKMLRVIESASSDQSSLLQVNFKPIPSSLLLVQPFYVLCPAKHVSHISRILTSKDPYLVKKVHRLLLKIAEERSIEPHYGTNHTLLPVECQPDDKNFQEHPGTVILIYVLNHKQELIISGERPHKHQQRTVPRAAHSQLAKGLPVYAAGELILQQHSKYASKWYYLREITNGSGHYKPNTRTLQRALDAFFTLAGVDNKFRHPMEPVTLTNSIACGIPVLSQV